MEYKHLKVELKTPEEIDKLHPKYGKVLPKAVEKHISRYNKWVKDTRRKMTSWRPRPWRSDLKKPFKFTNMFYSTSQRDLDENPELAKMDAEAELEPEED